MDIDLFARRVNKQLQQYIAWTPDPFAVAIDAFSVNWASYKNAYAFPPFSIISRVLRKLLTDKAIVTLIAPVWPSQPWFTRLLQTNVAPPRLLPPHCIRLPHDPRRPHPLGQKLRLGVFKLSRQHYVNTEYPQQHKTYSSSRGENQPDLHTRLTSHRGLHFVANGTSVSLTPL